MERIFEIPKMMAYSWNEDLSSQNLIIFFKTNQYTDLLFPSKIIVPIPGDKASLGEMMCIVLLQAEPQEV
jgi:hypothetical protein